MMSSGGSYVGHWIHIKMEADMGAKTWVCAAYNLNPLGTGPE